ncbi:MAG TPA: tyrosine-type recombinase/integrase [Candidatus Saccharimonadales bacterium]|nr:tyrosine-type recombinase/integrase [Candidatus Saccharimonadales bacterium]
MHTIDELLDPYLEYCDHELGLSKKTIYDNYARELNKLRRWAGDRPIEQMSIDELNVYFRLQEGWGLSISSVNTYRGYVRAFVYYCQFYLNLPLKFDYKMIRQKKGESGKTIKYATVDDATAAISVLDDPQDKLIVAILFTAGLRIGELVKLKFEDVYETKLGPEIEVRGKGQKTRRIPITYELYREIQAHAYYNNIRSGVLIRHRVSKRTLINKGYTVSGLRNRFIRKLSPYEIYPAFHWYRHGIATDLYNDGADIRWLQEFLGHSDIRTTQIYTHVSTERSRHVYDKHFPTKFRVGGIIDKAMATC